MSDTNKKYLDLPGLTEYHSYVIAALDEKASAADFIVLTDRVDLMALEHQNFATKDDLKNISGNVVVDDHLSQASKNPVQNWVILAALKTEHDNTAATYATKEELSSQISQTWTEINNRQFATKSDLDNLTAGDVDAIGTEYFEEYKQSVVDINTVTDITIGSYNKLFYYTLDENYNLKGDSEPTEPFTVNNRTYGSIVVQLYEGNLDANCKLSAIINVVSNEIGPKIKALEDFVYETEWASLRDLEQYATISYVDTKWSEAITIIQTNFLTKNEAASTYATITALNDALDSAQTKLDGLVSGIEQVFLTKSDAKATYALKEDLIVTEDLVAMLQLEHQNFVLKTELSNQTFSATKVIVDFAGEDLNTYLDSVDDRIIALETANTNGIYVNTTTTIEIPAYYAIHQLELDQNYNLAGSSISIGKDTKANTSYGEMTVTLYQDVSKLKYQFNALNSVVSNEIGPKIKALEDTINNTEWASLRDLEQYATNASLQELSNTVSDLDEVVAALHTSIGTTDSDVAALDAKVTTLETDMGATAERVTDALNMIDDLNADMGNALDKIAALEARIKALEDALGAAMTLLDELNGEVI